MPTKNDIVATAAYAAAFLLGLGFWVLLAVLLMGGD